VKRKFMIAIINYGVGNLHSLSSSLSFLGLENIITADESEIRQADKIILPGVGAFSDAYAKLEATKLIDVIKDEVLNKKKPLLGICLGMQLLFDKSFEYGEHRGLSLIRGEVVPISEDMKIQQKIPHMGWNNLNIKRDNPLLKYVSENDYVYYVHSYYARNCDDSVLATSSYGGIDITGVVAADIIYGTQFHPEKSGSVGLSILRAFSEI